MSNINPYPQQLGEPSQWSNLDQVSQYSRLGDLISAAEEESVFDGLPSDASSTITDNNRIRGMVIAERLWLLGYLKAPSRAAAKDQFSTENRQTNFVPAVRAFQKDMGLLVDDWPGPITWQILDKLISFENGKLDSDWLENPEKYPGVLRAAQCRLHVLGLAVKPASHDFVKISVAGVKKFHQLVVALKALDDLGPKDNFLKKTKLTAASLELLLDQEKMIAVMAKSWKKVSVTGTLKKEKFFKYYWSKLNARQFPKTDLQKLLNTFFYRITLVEFWLLGYEVDLSRNSRKVFPVRGFTKPKRNQVIDEDLKDSIDRFAKQIGRSGKRYKKEISPELFIAIANMNEKDSETEINVLVAVQFQTQEAIDQGLEEARSRGSLSLWDGIKRVARWFKNIYKKGKKKISQWIKNTARLFYHKALQAFDAVKYAISLVTKSLQTLNGSVISSESFGIIIDTDGDVTIGIDSMANLSQARKASTRMKLESQRFVLATSIVIFFLSIIKRSIFSQWAALARALFRHSKRIVAAIKNIYLLEQKFATL